jgi:hypothetical protein
VPDVSALGVKGYTTVQLSAEVVERAPGAEQPFSLFAA